MVTINQPWPGTYEAAVDALGWCHSESGVDSRTRDALEAILDYAHHIEERLDRTREVNELWDGS